MDFLKEELTDAREKRRLSQGVFYSQMFYQRLPSAEEFLWQKIIHIKMKDWNEFG